MKKVFVLDTNVLILDPFSIYNFEDNDVVIPIYVLEELDKHKTRNDEVGRNARQVSRELDLLREDGNLQDGIELEDGGFISVYIPKNLNKFNYMDLSIVDNKILASALELQENTTNVILVSNDINLRIRSDSFKLKSEKYESIRINSSYEDLGYLEISVPSEQIDQFYENKGIDLIEEETLPCNDMVVLTSEGYQNHSALGRVSTDGKRIQMLPNFSSGIWGIKPRNKEQKHALDLLLDEEVMLVSLTGNAGCGKTILALAAGLQQVVEERKYRKVLISRPVIPMGKDVGFLPGTIQEKMLPWMKPIFDNIEYLTDVKNDNRGLKNRAVEDLMSFGHLEIEPLTYIRGRSIPNQFMIVDESQSLTPLEVKTIITRAGEGTKIVLTGDVAQIDNPYLDSESNGLTHVIKKMKGESIYGHTTLRKGERSLLAELGANLL